MTLDELIKFLTAAGSVLGILSALFIAINAFRGQKPKMLLDGSAAAENFQEIIIRMQTEMEVLKNKVDGKQLTMNLDITVEIDKLPTVSVNSYTWANKNDAQNAQTIPHRSDAGFGGMRRR